MRNISFESSLEIKHAYIVTSASEEERFSIAMAIASAAVCKEERNIPCGNCSACRKAEKGCHPDIKVICRGDDQEAKTVISVRQVRDVVLDASVLPNESERKVYIFRDGDAMNEQAQNASLKLLEEPPDGVILILCAEKPDIFLQTVRSRCVEITCSGSSKARTEYDDLADRYLHAVAAEDVLGVYDFCENNNEMKIPEMTNFVISCASAITDMLCFRRDSMGISREWLMNLENLMEKCVHYLKVNVNVKQVFGMIEVSSVKRKEKKEA